MSSSVYGSDNVRPESFRPRHMRAEAFTLKGLGKRALQHIVSAGELMTSKIVAKTEQVKDYASTQWHTLLQEVPDNIWPEAETHVGRHTAALQGILTAERVPVYADIDMLNLMMNTPYQQSRLEKAEHHFVDGMLTAYETTAAVGRSAVQHVKQLAYAD